MNGVTEVREILGSISVDEEGEDVLLRKQGKGNSTRWVFFVELRRPVTVRLLDYHLKRPLRLESLSLSMAPLDGISQGYFELPENGSIRICSAAKGEPPARLLVTVDALDAREIRRSQEKA